MTPGPLTAADPVRAVRAALEGGPPAWLVGGVVRDALLGRELRDIDVVVAGTPEDAARRIAAVLRGPVFPLSEAFGAWRALDRERRFFCDVSPLHGATIEEDLGRRDFTVNAMAVSLGRRARIDPLGRRERIDTRSGVERIDPHGGGERIDPHGGEVDLEARRLRVLGAQAYEDDPLRPLRLVRLAAELGFAPDPVTERLTLAAAHRLGEPSPERLFAELRRLVTAPGVLEGLDLAARLGILSAVLPELTALAGIEQSHFHHLDVYGHTIEVLRRLIELEADIAGVFGDLAPRVEAILAAPLADELTRGQALRFGALFHDVAKPLTRGQRPDGRVTFVGHDSIGERIVGHIFRRLRASERLRRYVGKLTREHLVLGFLAHERALSRRDVHTYLRRCEPVEVEVTVLSCADRLATRGPGQEPWIEAHLALARELMGPALDWRAHGPPQPPVRGDELASELRIRLGPEVGELLARLEEAVFTGEVTTREEALAHARRFRQEDRG